MKKIISLFIAAIIFISPLNMFSLNANANDFVDVDIVTVKADAPSEYGYVNYRFVDEDGNEVSPDSNSNAAPMRLAYSRAAALPASYDSRTNNCITAPKTQGNTGNCWAFASVSALESASILQGLDNFDTADYSEAHLAWFASKTLTTNSKDLTYGDGISDISPYLIGGNSDIVTSALARWAGLAEESDYPFDSSDISKMGNYDEKCRYDTGSGIIIKSSERLSSTTDVKNWIVEYGCVTAPLYYSIAYLNSDTNAYHYSGSNTINHEIAIVGWDDNFSVDNFKSTNKPSSDGAWLCKTSWGEDWGDNGYFWVSYETYLEYFNGYTTQSASNFYKNYTYNGAGWNGYIERTRSAEIANVFKCNSYETLSAISTYTLTPNATLNISIYTNLASNYSTPTEGTLATSWTTTLKNAGYHTIALPTEINLAPDSLFAVVIEFETQGEKIYIIGEIDTEDSPYAGNVGESFLNLPEYGWSDPGRFGMENVCIQAFTKCNHQLKTNSTPSTCKEKGNETTVCTQCGVTTQTTELPLADHSFSEWSEAVKNKETGKMESTRTCSVCSLTELQETDPPKGNFFSAIANFFSSFFGKIINAIKSLFN